MKSRDKKPSRKQRSARQWINSQERTEGAADAPTIPGRSIGNMLIRVAADCVRMIKGSLARLRVSEPQKRLAARHTIGFGDKRFVAVVEFEGERFLIGGAANSISLLARLNECATADVPFAEELRVATARKVMVQ